MQREKPKKKNQQNSSGKAPHLTIMPTWLSPKLRNIRRCQSDTSCFEAISFRIYSLSLAVVAFFASAIVLHIVADRIVLFIIKIKVNLWFFFCFSVFQFSSHKVRFSCVLLAWIVNIPFHQIVTVRISKPTLWVAHINYWIKWKVVNKVSRLRLQWGR